MDGTVGRLWSLTWIPPGGTPNLTFPMKEVVGGGTCGLEVPPLLVSTWRPHCQRPGTHALSPGARAGDAFGP